VPAALAHAFATSIADGWHAYADSYHLGPLPGAFPTFGAFIGAVAPPTPMTPPTLPLAQGTSAGESGLQPASLEAVILGHLGSAAADAEVASSIHQYVQWFGDHFAAWKAGTNLVKLAGQGVVPSFAPPLVLVGPVVGTCTGQLQAPPF
jgi:hypothetical protein